MTLSLPAHVPSSMWPANMLSGSVYSETLPVVPGPVGEVACTRHFWYLPSWSLNLQVAWSCSLLVRRESHCATSLSPISIYARLPLWAYLLLVCSVLHKRKLWQLSKMSSVQAAGKNKYFVIWQLIWVISKENMIFQLKHQYHLPSDFNQIMHWEHQKKFWFVCSCKTFCNFHAGWIWV